MGFANSAEHAPVTYAFSELTHVFIPSIKAESVYKQALEMASNNALVNYGYGILLLGGGFYPRSRMWRKAQVSRTATPHLHRGLCVVWM